MIDSKLEQRKNEFQNNNINIVEAREDFRLSLRKQKIDQYIFNKKERIMERKINEKSSLEINAENLNLPPEVVNFEVKDIEQYYEFMMNLLKSTTVSYVKFGVYLTRKQLTLEMNPPINDLVRLGFTQQLISNLENLMTDDQLVYEILWCFVNLTSTHGLISANYLAAPAPLLLLDKILKNHSNNEIFNHILWLLSHLSSESIDIRNIILSSTIYPRIMSALQQNLLPQDILRNGCWLFGNLIKGKPSPNLSIRYEITKILCICVKVPDLSTVQSSLWGIYYAIDNNESNPIIHLLIESGAAAHIVKNIGKNPSLYNITTKVIGNILSGDPEDVDEMLNYGVLDLLSILLNSSTQLIQKEAAWGLSNIAAGSRNQVAKLIESDVFRKIIDKANSLNNLELVLELIWTISNALSGSDFELCMKLLTMGILNTIISVLERFDNDVILVVTLEGLMSLFGFGESIKELTGKNPIVEKFYNSGGHYQLEKLQNHKSNDVFHKTEQIVNQFFTIEETNEIKN